MIDIKASNWQHYKEIIPKALPLFILYAVVEILKVASGLPESIVYHVMLFSTVIFVIYIIISVFCKDDAQVLVDIFDTVDTIDRTVQAKIYEGLQTYKFIDEFVGDDLEMLARNKVNNIAIRALVPSVFQNHHCREIERLKGCKPYINIKSEITAISFRRDRHRAGYIQLVMDKLPDGLVFDEAVNAYVCRLFTIVIGPTLIWACSEKINYYNRILSERKNISSRFRLDTLSKIEKNKKYIALIEDELGDSSILHKSILAKKLDFDP